MTSDETQELMTLGYTAEGIAEVEKIMRKHELSASAAHKLLSSAPVYDAERDKHIPGIGPPQ